jgi:phenylacetic acid degradation operon negative regulatory protein
MTGELDQLVSVLRSHGMPSVRNLLVTVFGDAIRPYDAAVSVRSLTRLLAPLDVSERLVRTSLTRLADDELVFAHRVGNRSFYGVHEGAQSLFDRAEQRIYHDPDREWDGRWTLAVVDAGVGTSDQRATLRRQLGWLGLGSVAPNVMASPVVTTDAVVGVVRDAGLRDAVIITRSKNVADDVLITDIDLARRVMPLDEMAKRYAEMSEWFGGLSAASGLSPAESFVGRTLLIATYRRVILADPRLPAELLPANWNGQGAYSLVADVYGTLWDASEQWITEVCETPDGMLSALGGSSRASRFP